MTRHDVAEFAMPTYPLSRVDPGYVGRHRETPDSWREPINQVLNMARLYGIADPYLLTAYLTARAVPQWSNPFLPLGVRVDYRDDDNLPLKGHQQ